MDSIMKQIFQILILGSLVVFLASCQDKIELDLPEGETFLVVDGWISNASSPHTVKLSYTSPYFDDAAQPAASDATVILKDDEGNESVLNEIQPGVYEIINQGVIGRKYQLYIHLAEGDIYESNFELLNEPVLIDTIYYQLSEREPSDFFDESPDDIYDVLIETFEPAGRGDHYRWRSFLNGAEARAPFDINIISDQLVDGVPVLEYNVTGKLYSIPDTVEIVQEMISMAAYEFLTQLRSQTAFVGSPFDTPPVPIIGNVRNLSNPDKYALGFFGAAGVDRAVVVVGD